MPAPAQAASDLTGLYVAVGGLVLAQVVGLAFAFVRWIASRSVEREDKDRQKLEQEVEDLRDEHDDRLEKLDGAIAEMTRAVDRVQHEGKQILVLVEGIRGAVGEVKANLDNRFEKQSAFYREELSKAFAQVAEKLEKLEFDLRQETTRAMRDAQQLASKRKRG